MNWSASLENKRRERGGGEGAVCGVSSTNHGRLCATWSCGLRFFFCSLVIINFGRRTWRRMGVTYYSFERPMVVVISRMVPCWREIARAGCFIQKGEKVKEVFFFSVLKLLRLRGELASESRPLQFYVLRNFNPMTVEMLLLTLPYLPSWD